MGTPNLHGTWVCRVEVPKLGVVCEQTKKFDLSTPEGVAESKATRVLFQAMAMFAIEALDASASAMQNSDLGTNVGGVSVIWDPRP